LYQPSKEERKNDLYVIGHCQEVGQKEDKEVTKAMEICSRIHKVAQELIRSSQLPRLDEFGKNLVTKELVEKMHDNTNQRK
jgi:hypothetical protein